MKASFPSGSESSSPLRENGSGGSPALSLNWRRFSADWSAKTNAGIAENAGKGLRRRCDRGSSQVGFALLRDLDPASEFRPPCRGSARLSLVVSDKSDLMAYLGPRSRSSVNPT